MTVRSYLSVCGLALAGAMVAPVQGAKATLSDTLTVGTFSQSTTDPADTPLVFGVQPSPSGWNWSNLPTNTKATVVGLTEPNGAVLDGTEIHMSDGSLLSDVVIALPGTLAGPNPAGTVIFLSDGDPTLTPMITSGSFPSAWSVKVMPETGLPQDMTSLLGTDVSVTVTSDLVMVPEPGTGALALLGLSVLGGYARRRRTA